MVQGVLCQKISRNDNHRLKRYIAKVTSIRRWPTASTASRIGGNRETGRSGAETGFFGIRPELVLKGGSIVWAQMHDDPNIPPGPVHGRPMFGAFGKALAPSCLTFVSAAAMDADIKAQLGLERTCLAVKDTRNVGKSALKLNSALPNVSVDPQTYEVFADGELLTCEPAEVLPLAQRYLLL